MTTLMKGETLDGVSPGVDVALHREPLGVVAGVTPFNFPMMIPLWFAPLAIATGNAFILKPSQRTPLSAMRLADLFSEAGFPDGVFNVVHGARETVEALIDHPQVEAISSVGGSEAARTTSWSCPTRTLKPRPRACSPRPSPMAGSGAWRAAWASRWAVSGMSWSRGWLR